MTLEERKNLIYDQLVVVAEDVQNLENKPSRAKAAVLINNLYEVMRQLSDFAEENGY